MRSETRVSFDLVPPTVVKWPWNGNVPSTGGGALGNLGMIMAFNSVVAITALWAYTNTGTPGDIHAHIYDALTTNQLASASTPVVGAAQWTRCPLAVPFLTVPGTDYVFSTFLTAGDNRFQSGFWAAGGTTPDGLGVVPANGGRSTGTEIFPATVTGDGFGTDLEYNFGSAPVCYFPPQPYGRLIYDFVTKSNQLSQVSAYWGAINDSALIARSSDDKFRDVLSPQTPYYLPPGIAAWVQWTGGLSAEATMRYDIVP